MLDLPPNLPEPVAAPTQVIERCVNYSARHFKVNPLVIHALIRVEGGKVGTLSKNSNGTYDMGIMQINTIHLPDIKKRYPKVGWKEVTYKPCINIGIGTWILSQRLSETSNYWKGVGNYHSKTPKYRSIYLKKVYRAYKKVLADYRAKRQRSRRSALKIEAPSSNK